MVTSILPWLLPAANDLFWCALRGLARVRLASTTEGIWHGAVALDALCALQHGWSHLYYGLRADGNTRPERGLWFDPSKLLLDPYAKRIGAVSNLIPPGLAAAAH